MLRRVAFPVSLAVAIAVAGLAAAALSAAPTGVTAPLQLSPLFPNGPYYAIGCSFSHRNNDDPVVFPRQPGRSHNHTYIGNRSVDADTTSASLIGGRSTLRVGERLVRVLDADPLRRAERRQAAHLDRLLRESLAPADLWRRPSGLVMIAGNSEARSRQPKGIVAWSCGAVGGTPRYATIPACREDQMLQLQATFPNCWDGRRLDSADHKQHLKYSSRGLCPASHPVAMPQIILIVLYPPVPLGSQVASGRFGAHADFMNGWDQVELERLVAERSLARR